MSLIVDENEIEYAFEEALRLRDADDHHAAKKQLLDLVDRLPLTHRRWLAIIHGQLGHLCRLLGDDRSSVLHYRISTRNAPHAELPSVAMFVALKRLGEWESAFEEAIRLLKLRRSAEYENYFINDYGQEYPLLSQAAHTLAERARNLVDKWKSSEPH